MSELFLTALFCGTAWFVFLMGREHERLEREKRERARMEED